MGKKGKKAQAGKAKKPTPKDIGKRLDALAKKLEEELKGADMFAPLQPTEDDCPICLVRLSRMSHQSVFQMCCGKSICKACFTKNIEFIAKQNNKNSGKTNKKPIVETCPLCRELEATSVGIVLRRLEVRASQGDYGSWEILAEIYELGMHGLRKDQLKANDCWIRATELGSVNACANMASSFRKGTGGIPVDMNKFALFDKVAVIRGDVTSRHNMGVREYASGNHEDAIRHWKIAAEAGSQPSLNGLRDIFNSDGKFPGKEFISKGDLDNIYRAGHEAQEMVKSEEREKQWEEKDRRWKC